MEEPYAVFAVGFFEIAFMYTVESGDSVTLSMAVGLYLISTRRNEI